MPQQQIQIVTKQQQELPEPYWMQLLMTGEKKENSIPAPQVFKSLFRVFIVVTIAMVLISFLTLAGSLFSSSSGFFIIIFLLICWGLCIAGYVFDLKRYLKDSTQASRPQE